MAFHAELSRPVPSRSANTVPSAFSGATRGAVARREPLYDALHACPTRRMLGWRMSDSASIAPEPEAGATVFANERL